MLRIVAEENFLHITSSGKGVQSLPFLKKQRNSRLKEDLHGWQTKYTGHLGR
jgi:hypothetical protein